MSISNVEIAAKLNELADLLEIEGESSFRIRAYRNAARNINELSQSLASMLSQKKDLTKLPGIGESIAKKIKILVKTGELPQLKKIRKKIPKALSSLLLIEGLGPKRVKKLHENLNIKNLAELNKAIQKGKVAELPGFGSKTEKLIKRGIKNLSKNVARIKLADGEKLAESIIKYLKKISGIKKVDIAGSYRRRKETIGDLDILVVASKGEEVIKKFIRFEEISHVASKGTTRSTVFLRSGMQVDLRVVSAKSYGAALLYFTGSKSHNIAVRHIAVKKKLKINEYGMFKGKRMISGKTEKEMYQKIGLAYIEPELRENRGEIEAAQKKNLPKLITLKDIRGDLHSHTNATDGNASLAEMAHAAKEIGYDYLAITDHSQHLTVAHGLNKKELLKQIKQIDKLNEKLKNFTILKSIEVDILEDGRLDLPDDILKELDLTVCSVHYKFNLSKKKQTERILRAMENPHFKIFAHPSGRLIGRRSAYEIDIEKIMKAAKENHCILEINAQPDRMDLDDVHAKMAQEIGVKIAISTDSHSKIQLNNMRYGIDIARRGWVQKNDVINTYTLLKLKKIFKR